MDIGRRQLLVLMGAIALGGRAHAQSYPVKPGVCVVTPRQTEGPYFLDKQLNRFDIRTDPADRVVREGVTLALNLRVSSVKGTGCTPLGDAIVDIWHCDAAGVYSGVDDSNGKRFLRGYQVTDANGRVRFTTIYPGAYPGRAVHIHFKVRTQAKAGRAHEFTSQLYFDDAVTDRVHAHKAYASSGRRRLRNDGDGVFRGEGRRLLVTPIESSLGYTAAFDIGLQLG